MKGIFGQGFLAYDCSSSIESPGWGRYPGLGWPGNSSTASKLGWVKRGGQIWGAMTCPHQMVYRTGLGTICAKGTLLVGAGVKKKSSLPTSRASKAQVIFSWHWGKFNIKQLCFSAFEDIHTFTGKGTFLFSTVEAKQCWMTLPELSNLSGCFPLSPWFCQHYINNS